MSKFAKHTIDTESERKKKEGVTTRSLRELYDQHGGKITDTWSLYADELDKVLSVFRDKQIAILEIGVQNGGSLEIWSEYFPKAQKIVGVDIDPKCGELHFADPRISVLVSDATSEEGKSKVLRQAPAFDLIIDDGSHKSDDIVRAFSRYFPVLKEGGLYIVEDVHTNYWADYEGGLHNPLSAMSFFKRLADITNYEHWRNNRSREYLLREFSAKYEVPFENLDLARIHSVRFANSLCIIGKAAPDSNVLGKRNIAGAEEHVTSGSKKANLTLIHDIPVNIEDDTRLDVFELIKSGDELREELAKGERILAQVQAQLQEEQERLTAQVTERDGQIVSLNQGIAEREEQLIALNQGIAERDSQLANLNQAVAEYQEQLTTISHTLAERDGQIVALDTSVKEQEGRIGSLEEIVREKDSQILSLSQTVTERDGRIAAILSSTSWRLTRPMRLAADQLKRMRRWFRFSLGKVLFAPKRFDAEWYLKQNPDVAMSGMEPYKHYILFGKSEGRQPVPDVPMLHSNKSGVYRLLRITLQVIAQKGGIWRTCAAVIRVYRREGLAGVKYRIGQLQTGSIIRNNHKENIPAALSYNDWVRWYDTFSQYDRQAINQRIKQMNYKPLISVIMPVYNSQEKWLRLAIESVYRQLYPNWELCIADDCSSQTHVREVLEEYQRKDSRIKVVFRSENGHISKASNSALDLAEGEFIALLDHDDELSEHALYLVVEELNRNKELDFIYSDQDKIDTNGERYDPYFKPDFNPDLLRSQNYVDHLSVFRTSIVRNLGGWRPEFDGSQDYDMVLRVVERTTPSRVRHIPYVLYHWRSVSGSIASDAGDKGYAASRSRQALAEHLRRLGIEAKITSNYPALSIHRVVYPLPAEPPLVSVIVPTKDGIEFLKPCIDGLLNKTDYPKFEVIVVNNCSEKPETHTFLTNVSTDSRIKVLDYNQPPFNYSRINNFAVREAAGDILVFLNNDVEVINRDWLREMVSHAIRPEIGAVGARLYYPDDTVQHAGVFLGYKGRAGHFYRYTPRYWMGHWARGVLTQNLTAVTAACMVIRRAVFDAVGGFDEENFSITFNDVDLCLRIHQKGYRNLYTPFAELYHLESKTRGLLAIRSEEDYFVEKWKYLLESDPAYNPNITLESEDLSPAFPPRIRHPWLEKKITAFNSGDFPLVTIITRTYGERREFLSQALESIFRQTYRPIHVVIVEDGSKSARSLVEKISIPDGVSIDYESLPKKGRCYAGNRGLQMARGEMVCFLDDDDQLSPDHIELLAGHLLTNTCVAGAYSSSWLVPTDVISTRPLKYTEGKRQLFGRTDFSLSALWDYNFIPIQSLMFRRELYVRHGGLCEELNCFEDWDLWLRYSAEKDFIFVDKPTSLFRIPANESVRISRKDEHMSYLPVIRRRQKELVERYRNTPYYERLRGAFDAIATEIKSKKSQLVG